MEEETTYRDSPNLLDQLDEQRREIDELESRLQDKDELSKTWLVIERSSLVVVVLGLLTAAATALTAIIMCLTVINTCVSTSDVEQSKLEERRPYLESPLRKGATP